MTLGYTFKFRLSEHEGYDCDVVVKCYYADSDKIQAEWYGFWRIETELEKASTLFVDMSLINALIWKHLKAVLKYRKHISFLYLCQASK